MKSFRPSKLLSFMLVLIFIFTVSTFNPIRVKASLPENEFHYDVDLINDAIGVSDGTIFEPAVVFRSDILNSHIGEKINRIKIGIFDREENTYPKEITIKIYGKGSDGAPGNLLYSAPYTIESPGWKEIPVTSNIFLNGEDIWVGYSISNNLYQYYAGATKTNFVPNVNYIYFQNNWNLLSNYGLNYNWHIRLITEIDQTNPELLSFNINNGSAATNSTAVLLKQTAQDETTPASLLKMRFSNDAATWSDWETIAAEKNWTLTDGEGEKTVYIQIKDLAGNIIDGSSSITLDTTAPSFVEIGPKNSGNLFGLENDIEVTFNEALAQGQQFSMITLKDSSDAAIDASFVILGSKLIINPAQALNGNSAYKLFIPANALTDLVGNILNEDLNFDISTINPDIEAPVIDFFKINNGASMTNNLNIKLYLNAHDDISPANKLLVRFSVDGTTWSEPMPYTGQYDYVLPAGDGLKKVYVMVIDESLKSTTTYASVTLDTTPPKIELFAELVEGSDTITITFNEEVKSTAKINTITIKDGSGNAISYTPSISNKKLILKMAQKAKAGSTYTITVVAGSVSDIAENPTKQDYTNTFNVKKVSIPKTGTAAPFGYMLLALASIIMFKKNK